jgi:two-component system nitrate/nitrite response regulator NarL
MISERHRVLVAEATPMSGQLIAGALRRCKNNFDVRAFSGDWLETFHELQSYKPHVSLISAKLRDGALTGLKVVQRARGFEPKTATVILVDSDDRDLVVAAFRAGARGVFCRGYAVNVLSKCIRCVSEGQIWASNAHLEYLLDVLVSARLSDVSNRVGMALLTPRERDVARLVAEGLRNQEISVRLRLREHTVRNYVLRIFDKWGVSSRVELVLYAISLPENEQASEAPLADLGVDSDSLQLGIAERARESFPTKA